MPPRLPEMFAVPDSTPDRTLSLLRRLLLIFPLRLFLLRLVRFPCPRRRLLTLWLSLRTRFRRRRRTALGLRTLARRRSLRPLSRLTPIGRRLTHFRSIVWLRCRRTIRFRPSVRLRYRRTIRFRPIIRLRCRRSIRFRPIIRLRCRRKVRFRLVVWLRRPVGASSIVRWTRRRGIGRRLNCGTIHWRVIRRSRRFGRYDGAVVKCSRLRSSSDCRFAMVHGSTLLRIRAGRLRMLSLNRYRRNMFLTCRRCFLRPGARADPTRSAVVADPVHPGAVDHCGVVNVVNHSDVHVVHRTVVEKVSVIPTSTFIAFAVVTVAVTNPAIETDVLTPVAIVEDISVAAPTPIGWSPQETDFRSHHPRTRHPVVIVVGISPVSGCPEITIAGTKGLLVNR